MSVDADCALTVSGQAYRVQEYVFVQPPCVDLSSTQSNDDMKGSNVHEFWVAKILEFRAKDECHVYARVSSEDHLLILELTLSPGILDVLAG